MIAKVEPLTPARALRGPFDYRLAGGLEGVGVGSMLVVPFGARRLLGVVVELAEQSEIPPERLVQPLAALEADVPEPLVCGIAGKHSETVLTAISAALWLGNRNSPVEIQQKAILSTPCFEARARQER